MSSLNIIVLRILSIFVRIYIQYALNIPIFHVQIRQIALIYFMSTTGSYIATYKTSQCGSLNRARVYAIFTYKSDAMQKCLKRFCFFFFRVRRMASGQDFKCYFCPCAFAVFNEMIDHNIIFHPEN